eukprot:6478263-Amphidinium_carterae.1
MRGAPWGRPIASKRPINDPKLSGPSHSADGLLRLCPHRRIAHEDIPRLPQRGTKNRTTDPAPNFESLSKVLRMQSVDIFRERVFG